MIRNQYLEVGRHGSIMFLTCISEMTSYLQSVAILVPHLVVSNLCTTHSHKLCETLYPSSS